MSTPPGSTRCQPPLAYMYQRRASSLCTGRLWLCPVTSECTLKYGRGALRLTRGCGSYDEWDLSPVSQNHTNLSCRRARNVAWTVGGGSECARLRPRGFESHSSHWKLICAYPSESVVQVVVRYLRGVPSISSSSFRLSIPAESPQEITTKELRGRSGYAPIWTRSRTRIPGTGLPVSQGGGERITCISGDARAIVAMQLVC